MLNFLQKSKLIALVLFVIVVLQSGHAMQTIIPGIGSVLYIPVALGALILFVALYRKQVSKSLLVLFAFVLMIALTSIAYEGVGFSYYLSLFYMIFAAFAISELYPFEKLIKVYLWVMTVTSIVALIGYIMLTILGSLSFLPQMTNHNDIVYQVGIIYNYIPLVPDRNCGMFWEPGLFATHLAFAFLFELITKEKASIFRLILFSACIFTANSSAGFVLWFLCILLIFLRKERKGAYGTIKPVLSFLLICVAIAFVLNFDTILSQTSLGENPYFQKLASENVGDSSRSNAVSHNMEIFMTDPLFGAGYHTVSANMDYVADTSTSTYLMSIFGIFGALYTVFWVYGVATMKRLNFLSKIVVFVIIMLIVNKEPHHQLLFTWILLFYFIKLDSLKPPQSKKVEQELPKETNEI